MGIISHFVVDSFDESRGGQAQSAVRIARHLASASAKLFLYSVSDLSIAVWADPPANSEMVALALERPAVLEPLGAGEPDESIRELPTVDLLLLRAAMRHRLRNSVPEDDQLVVSLSLRDVGFLAQHVADSLALPHLGSVRGEDFTFDFRSPTRIAAVAHVAKRAQWLVTSNREQALTLARAFGVGNKITTIHNAVSRDWSWRYRHACPEIVHVVSDSGYSLKKGTHILLHAVENLLAEGVPLRLTLVGPTEAKRQDFWRKLRRGCSDRFPSAFDLRDWVPLPQVRELLKGGNLYASATLGEGSSNGALAALICGIPIVSTDCGSLADLARDEQHVVLTEPGNCGAFQDSLREMCRRISTSRVEATDDCIDRLRLDLDPAAEQKSWQQTLLRALAITAP